MRPVATFVVLMVGLSVCLSVGPLVSPAKMAEPIDIPFGTWTWVDHTHHIYTVFKKTSRDESASGRIMKIGRHLMKLS